MDATKKLAWNSKSVKGFVQSAVKSVGQDTWDRFLVPNLKRAVIAEKCLAVVSSQMHAVEPDQMDMLLAAMLVEAGLREGS